MNGEATASLKLNRVFSTPLGLYRIPDPMVLNTALGSIVLAREAASPSTRRSNIGGWRSRPDLLDADEAPIDTLRNHINSVVLQTLRAINGAEGFSGHIRLTGWANVLRRGNYNTPHNHPQSVWSGVYYVDAGTQASSADSLSGVLEFMDPRPQVGMVPGPGFIFGQPIRIQPEAGLLVIFPSWLYHHVHVYQGERPRIAIAFNVPIESPAPDA